MPTYNTAISRDASDDPLVPTPVAAEIIQQARQSSAVLSLARRVPMASGSQRMPVLSALPTAYWVDGDTGLKQTSSADWSNATIKAEELAVLVPIPDAYAADAQVNLGAEVQSLLAEAIGTALDAACLFGTNAPTSFGTGVYFHALAAGNAVVTGAGEDLADEVANVAELVAGDGFNVNGFASKPGFTWKLNRLRTDDGVPIYQPNLQGGPGRTLFGFPLNEVANGAWDSGEALLIAGDWTKAIVGVRQDITLTKHTDGVISDADGVVVYNAMQQDSTIYRCVFRAGFVVANPKTRIASGTASPFGVVQATTANS